MNQLQKDTLEFAAETASELANEAKLLREEWFRLNTELEHTKAELSEWRGKAVRKEAEAIESRKELDRLQGQVAAMRHALAQVVCMNLTVPNALLAAQACCELALASDAGKDYISKADVKPLVEALLGCEVLIRCLAERRYGEHAMEYLANRDNWCRLMDALKDAKAKGLLL